MPRPADGSALLPQTLHFGDIHDARTRVHRDYRAAPGSGVIPDSCSAPALDPESELGSSCRRLVLPEQIAPSPCVNQRRVRERAAA